MPLIIHVLQIQSNNQRRAENILPVSPAMEYDLTVSPYIQLFDSLLLSSFALLVGAGGAIGLLWTLRPGSESPQELHAKLDAGLLTLAGALVGGRAAYTAVNWPYFQHNPAEIPAIWLGGISWAGAVIGGGLSGMLAMKILPLTTNSLWDDMLPLFTSLVASSWMASWLTGYAYGAKVTDWWGVLAWDEWGTLSRRWPTQLVGALSALVIHWLVEKCRDRGWLPLPGLAASLELAGFSLTFLALSPFRADPAPLWRGVRLDTWAAGVFLALASSFLLTRLLLPRPPTSTPVTNSPTTN